MNIFIAAIFFILIPMLVLNKQYKYLIVICLISLINNLFFFDFSGTRIPLHSYVALVSFPFLLPYYKKIYFSTKVNFFHILSWDFISLVVLGIIFSFVYPWPLPGEVSWNQMPMGRSLVALFRLFLDIALVVFVHFCMSKNKITIQELLKVAFILAFIQIGVGLIDYFANYPIRSILFTERQIPGRFLGMSHEPRSMARNTSFVLLLFICAWLHDKKIFEIKLSQIVILFLGVVFTFSVSNMIALAMSGLSFFILKNKKNRFKYLGGFILFFFLAFQAIKTTRLYRTNIVPRITMVALGGLKYGVIKGEPLIFTRLELIDRAAANFFYHHPQYLFFGTGPNLMGIPSSPYRTKSSLEAIGKTIISVPGTGVIYTLGRNGIFGILMLLILYRHLQKKSTSSLFKSNLLFFTFFYFLFVHPSWFFFNIGLISGNLQD